MKKFTLFLTIALALGCVVSASAQRKVERVVEISTAQARNVEPKTAIIVAPQIAELTVSTKRATGSYSYPHNGTVDVANARAQALSDFQKEHNADVIVGALIDTHMNAETIVVNIQGYPATYSRVRPATANDQWMLNFINAESYGKNTQAIGK